MNYRLDCGCLQSMYWDRFVTQLCLIFWSGGMSVLLAGPKMTSFWPSQPVTWMTSFFKHKEYLPYLSTNIICLQCLYRDRFVIPDVNNKWCQSWGRGHGRLAGPKWHHLGQERLIEGEGSVEWLFTETTIHRMSIKGAQSRKLLSLKRRLFTFMPQTRMYYIKTGFSTSFPKL
jgi:hypothetical protein